MLLFFLLVLLVIATVTLFALGALMAHQERLEEAQLDRTVAANGHTVTLGQLFGDVTDNDEQTEAKLQLEYQAQRQMADIIG